MWDFHNDAGEYGRLPARGGRMTVRNDTERKEIDLAFSRVYDPKNTMVSRQTLVFEIISHPLLYPFLSRQSLRYLRYVITMEMNARYQVWNERKTGKRSNWVWFIGDKPGVFA